MRNTKQQTITDGYKRIYTDFRPSTKEEEVLTKVFTKFRNYQEFRDKPNKNFDGLTLIEYINDSYNRYTTNLYERDGIEDWQSISHDPVTRNKVNAVLSKIISVLPISQIQPRGDEDKMKASLLNEIYEYSEDVDDYEDFMVRFVLDGIVKGTSIGFEGHEIKEKKIRKIVSGEGDTIKVEEDVIKSSRLFAELIPLEDFYPSSLNVGKIKDLGSVFVRKTIPYSKFLSNYSSVFSKSIYVKPCISSERFSEERPYYYDFISSDIQEGSVEMLFFYDESSDEYIITSNGVWLNPINITEQIEEEGVIKEVKEHEEVSPIPYNHKELPFFDIRFELFSPYFFYGKSLPDKLKVLQDTLDVFENMLNDQSMLSIFQPMLIAGDDSMEDDYLVPGRRTPIDTKGLPINQAVMKLDMGTPGGWHQFILDYTRRIMEEASVDKVSQGIAGAGDRVTAREISLAAEGVSSLLGLFGKFINYAIKRKADLRVKNILQFWTDKETAKIEGILGGGGSKVFAKAFKTITLDGVTLTGGKRGMKVIGIFDDKQNMPTSQELKDNSDIYKLFNKKDIEYIAITSDYLKDINYDIKNVVVKKTELTRDMDKAIFMEKVRIYLSFFPELTDKQELFSQLAEKFGDDPTKIMTKDSLESLKGEPKQDNPDTVSMSPEGDIMRNSMYGAMGKEVGVQNMKQMLG